MRVRQILFFSIIIVSFFVISGFVHSISTLIQKNSLIVQAQRELDTEKKKNQRLKQTLETVKKPQYVEQEARNKLFLLQPGENVLFIPTVSGTSSAAPKTSLTDSRPVWKQWWKLFF
jgi:cell division protein FtsB